MRLPRCALRALFLLLLRPPSVHGQQIVPSVVDSSLAALTREALERHPALRQRREAWSAAGERVRPAGALPDPTLGAGLMDLPLSRFGFGQSDFTELDVEAAQQLPWPGTLGARTAAASAAREERRADLGVLRREVSAAVAAAYYRLRYLTTAFETLARQRRLLQAAVELTTTRYATGAAPQSDALQARLARERLLAEEAALRGEAVAALAALNALRARPSADSVFLRPLDLTELGAHLVPLSPAESLVAAALTGHPRVAARRAALEQAAFGVRLERLGARPDFAIQLRYGYRGTVGGVQLPDFFSAAVGVRVPLWAGRKQSRLVEAARADSAGAAASLSDAERELSREVAETVARAEAGRRRIELLANSVVPVARATVESVTRSYQVGRTEFLALLAAEDSLYRAELEVAAVAAEHLTHLVMLRLLTAGESEP